MAAKLLGLLTLVALVYAKDQIVEENDDNDITRFEYNIADVNTGDFKRHEESRIGENVRGKYKLLEPDGSTRTVYYTAGDEGFNAVVLKQPTSSGTTDVEDPLADNTPPCFSGPPYIPKKSSLNFSPAFSVISSDPTNQVKEEFPQAPNTDAEVSLDKVTDSSQVRVSDLTSNSPSRAPAASSIYRTSFISQRPYLTGQAPIFAPSFDNAPAVPESPARAYVKTSSHIVQTHDQPTYAVRYRAPAEEPTKFFSPFSSEIQDRPTFIQNTPSQTINLPAQPFVSFRPTLTAQAQDASKLLVSAPEYLTYGQSPNYAQNYVASSAEPSSFVSTTPVPLQQSPNFITSSSPKRPVSADQTPEAPGLISNAPEYLTSGQIPSYIASYSSATSEPSILVTPRPTAGISRRPVQFTNSAALITDRTAPIDQAPETTASLANPLEYLPQQFSQQIRYSSPFLFESSLDRNPSYPAGSTFFDSSASSKASEESTASLYLGSRPYYYNTAPYNPYFYSSPSLLQSSSNLQEQFYKSTGAPQYSLYNIQPSLSGYAGNFYTYPWKK